MKETANRYIDKAHRKDSAHDSQSCLAPGAERLPLGFVILKVDKVSEAEEIEKASKPRCKLYEVGVWYGVVGYCVAIEN